MPLIHDFSEFCGIFESSTPSTFQDFQVFARAFGVVRYDSQTHPPITEQETSGRSGLCLASYGAWGKFRLLCTTVIFVLGQSVLPYLPGPFGLSSGFLEDGRISGGPSVGAPKPLKKMNWTFHAVKVGLEFSWTPSYRIEKTPRNPKRLLGKKGANPSRFSRRSHRWKYDTLPSTLPSTKTHHFSKLLFFLGGVWFQKYDCSPQVSLDSISASRINVWQIYLDLVDFYYKLYVYLTYMDLVGMGEFGFKLQFPTTHCFGKTCAPWPGVTACFNGDNTTNSSSKCSPLSLKLGHGFPWPKLTGQLLNWKNLTPQFVGGFDIAFWYFWATQVLRCEVTVTPLKTNMSPENQWLEDVFPIEMVPFWWTC